MFRIIKIALILSIIFTLSSSISINCNFRTIFLTMGSGYGCDGKATNDGSSQISTINGNHQTGKSNNDTEVFRIWNDCTLELIPQKIGEFFPNLIAIWFNDCKFKEVEADDFVNMTNLVELDLAYNQLEFVHEKAFGNLKNLQILYLSNNRIIYVGPNVLQTLPNLVYVTFESNFCISANSFNFEDSDMRNFIIDVAIQCPLTIKIAEALLNRKNVEVSRNYIRDLREVVDNVMMVHEDDEDDDEVRFDDYRSYEPNDENLEDNLTQNVKENYKDDVEVAMNRNLSPRELSESNKLHESKKVEIGKILTEKLSSFDKKVREPEVNEQNLKKIVEKLNQENLEMKKIIEEIKSKLG